MGRKKDAIVKAGRHLFLSKGIAVTSMDQIAEAVPVSKMTLYNIFGSKEGLLEAVMQNIIDEGIAFFEQAVNGASDPLDALNRLAAVRGIEKEMTPAFLKDLQGYPELMGRMIRVSADEVMPRFEKIILEGQQLGQIRKDLSPIVIVSFLQSMKEYFSRSDVLFGTGSPETVGQQITTIFYHGILAKE